MHGAQTRATSLEEINSLQRRVHHYYKAFEKDKFIVQSSESHLFSRLMSIIQQMSRDAMVAWLASVQEAIDRQRFFNEKEAKGSSNLLQRWLGKYDEKKGQGTTGNEIHGFCWDARRGTHPGAG